MRKLTAIVCALLLLGALAVTALAAGSNLHMADVQAKPGDTVYLTVSLAESTVGNAVGVTYSFDEKVLEVDSAACTWARKGVLQDFSQSKHEGVWAVSDGVDLKGDLCVLAFRVRETAAFSGTEVTCSVVIKNGAKEVGTYQATANIHPVCSHSFGSWADRGELGHARSCALCSQQQTQPHDWKEKSLAPDPQHPGSGLQTYACAVCGAERTESVPGQIQEIFPTAPDYTRPPEETEPDAPADQTHPQPSYPEEREEELPTAPTAPTTSGESTRPTAPGNNNDGDGVHGGDKNVDPPIHDYNRPPSPTEETGEVSSDGHDHDHQPDSGESGRETTPIAIPIDGWTGEEEDAQQNVAGADQEHDHDHEVSQTKGDPGSGALIAGATVAVMAAGAWLYLKKKR